MTGPVLAQVGWTTATGGLALEAGVTPTGAQVRRRDLHVAGAQIEHAEWSEPVSVAPWELSRALVSALPTLPDGDADGAARVPASDMAGRVHVVVEVAVTEAGTPSLLATFWGVEGRWWTVEGPPEAATCRPCNQRLVEVVTGHAGLHALLRAEEARSA